MLYRKLHDLGQPMKNQEKTHSACPPMMREHCFQRRLVQVDVGRGCHSWSYIRLMCSPLPAILGAKCWSKGKSLQSEKPASGKKGTHVPEPACRILLGHERF